MGVMAISMSVLSAHGASAKNAVLYKIGKLPGFIGIVIKDGKMFAPVAMIDRDSKNFDTMNRMVKLDLGGKPNCLTSEWVDDDTTTYVKSCASAEKTGEGSYILKITIKYDWSAWLARGKEELQLLKEADNVKERRYEIDFKLSGKSCSAVMVKRTYIPIDGKRQVPSTVGDLGCVVSSK
jgi:hypothetical protein